MSTSAACFENPPTLSSTYGKGTVLEFGGLKTYVTGSTESKLAVLLVSDVFGYENPNIRKLADKVAAAGFFVVVPDFFYGDPVNFDNPQFDRESWLIAHSKEKGYEDSKSVLAALKSQGVSAIRAAGFCWGGVVVAKLAKSDDIKAAVILHPGRLADEDIHEVKVHTAILGAEIDKTSPPEQLKQFEEILSVKSEVLLLPPYFSKLASLEFVVSQSWTATDTSSLSVVLFVRKTEEIMSGPQCCANPPTLNPTSGSGHVEKLGGLDSYLTGSPDSKLAIVLVSDIYGYEAPNLRKLADKVAAAGFFVVVPDFFYGDPYVLPADGSHGGLPTWLKGHGPEKGFEDVKLVIGALKSKGVSAIGAAGFSLGAKVVVELAKGDFIQAAVLAHPSSFTVDDIKAVKVPISILGAEIDQMSPPEVVKQFEEALAAKSEIKSHVKIFPKVSHGWTVRYDVSDKEAVKPAEEAHKDLLEWFVNHVK